MEKRTILIVGGAGYIGSQVNKILNASGYQTIVLDNLSKGNQLTVVKGTFIQGDIGDSQLLDKIFNTHSIDAVMHFAAFIDVGESVYDPAKYYQNNVVNTLILLQAMQRHQVKTFIFSSTAAIFGLPQTTYIAEDHPCVPINPYGQTKWMVERILRDFDRAYGLRFCALRYFNAAGGDPEGEIKFYQSRPTNLIPLVLQNIKNGTPLKVNGIDYPTPDGTCVRDYIHIEDLGTAHILGMEKLFAGSPSLFYNLGNGNGYSIREVIQAAEIVTGKKLSVEEGPRRPGDPAILAADASKALRELNWKPKYPDLETMIAHAWTARQ